MSSSRERRLLKELQDVEKDKLSQITIEPVESDKLGHFKGSFVGPRDTPYEGGRYILDIMIPADYPFRPPKIKFDTKIWHPNCSSQTGAICLDILKDNWSPVLTLKSSLLSVQSMLECPEPNDPQDAEVAKQYLSDRAEFNKTARQWAVAYAGADKPTKTAGPLVDRKTDEIEKYGLDRKSVESLVGMGFDRSRAILAFRDLGMKQIDNDQDVQRLLGRLL